MNVFWDIFYKLRTVLHKNQLIFANTTYMQPILQYGVLIYGTAAKSNIKNFNNKIKQLVRIFMGNVTLSQLKTSELQQKLIA